VALGRLATATVAGAVLAALWPTGLISWRRTRALRGGRSARPAVPPAAARSSPTTWLAGAAGVAVTGWGALSLPDAPFAGVVAIAAGALVAASGIRSRVSRLEVRDDALVVHRAFRTPITLGWTRLRELRGPWTPIGGWRLRGGTRRVTLMPSDLLGNEAALDAVIERAGLRFDGRRWTRPP
jgi:hypothetical protein